MKKNISLFLLPLFLVFGCSPKTDKDKKLELPVQFKYSVQLSTSLKHLPALQSFVFAHDSVSGCWLLFSGRTNGFHSFPSTGDSAFMVTYANKYAYAYNPSTDHLDSLQVSLLPAPLNVQYTFTNLESTQIGNNLYVCGGYGSLDMKNDSTSFVTSSTISRINVSQMVSGIVSQNTASFASSVVFDPNPNAIVCSTGGELYKMPDGKFYLSVGHNYSCFYNPNVLNNPSQIYLDSVHIFKLNETPTSIAIDPTSLSYISDNLPDASTIFRRRDLNVAPAIQADGHSIGLTIYGGVFTHTNAGGPFVHPIYITPGPTPGYQQDNSFTQLSNYYAAPHVEMYDSTWKRMYTTIFGGIGDATLFAKYQDSASFTPKILTIQRSYLDSTCSAFCNPDSLQAYIGSEAVFVRANGLPYYNAQYNIINFNLLMQNDNTLVGYIYGGIRSSAAESSDALPSNTYPSRSVYEVHIIKINSSEAKK